MSDVIIKPGRAGIPHHAFKQADGTYLLCARKVELCRECKAHGVPVIPADPFQAAIDLYREHWAKRWRESFRPAAYATQRDGLINQRAGAHIFALSDDGSDVTVLGQFGDDEAVMTDLAALVFVHNEMIREF